VEEIKDDISKKIAWLQKYVKEGKHRFTLHAVERCIERDISPVEIEEVILSGEIIEDYPHDKYGPTCLVYGATKKGRILHVLCSLEPVWIITAYDPKLRAKEWDESFKVRRKKT